MAGMVRPAIRRGTRLIDLYVTHPDPVMAQRLAEAVGREYIRNSIERRASLSEEALRYLLEEEERLKTNLQKSEAAVADYKAKIPTPCSLAAARLLPVHKRDRAQAAADRAAAWWKTSCKI
jgi:Predicted Zn-dependent peptidases, insulinase-like